MKYPKAMMIGGQKVSVELRNKPLYQMYECPTCKGFLFPGPVDSVDVVHCPACKVGIAQPQDNHYIVGQFLVKQGKIENWADSSTEELRNMTEKSFVHETIEAIDSINDLGLAHSQITTLASCLYEAFSTGGVDFAEAA